MHNISDEDLQAITGYIISLEQQCDFLMRERTLYREGASALVKMGTAAAISACPPGCSIGNAGQVYVSDHETIYAMMQAGWPSRKLPGNWKKPE